MSIVIACWAFLVTLTAVLALLSIRRNRRDARRRRMAQRVIEMFTKGASDGAN